ncbi:hypothetical protein [Archangium sp.]|uniref:hypothetical protein n=1 Tax=Archangium sp. TaxID=1872627 RepID=UPI002D45CB48|nr:hypothetical protein [Archangium sp.]HYO56190.1 hypothetical protein [Archangium sp.]
MCQRREEEDPALTEELRAVMRPRSGWPLIVLVLLAMALAVLALVASRTALSGLWD